MKKLIKYPTFWIIVILLIPLVSYLLAFVFSGSIADILVFGGGLYGSWLFYQIPAEFVGNIFSISNVTQGEYGMLTINGIFAVTIFWVVIIILSETIRLILRRNK